MRPTAPLRAMPGAVFVFGEGEGSHRGAQPGRGPVLPHPAEAEPGPSHTAFRTRCTSTVQRVRSEAHYAAAVPRLARPASCNGPCKTREHAALPHWAEAEPGFPHVVRIRTDIFLRRGKCPRCRVRWGETGRSISFKVAFFFARAARGAREVLRGVAAPLSAAARGVSDTLPSHRAACSLRGALRGGSVAAGSACIVQRAG